jgi:hypothetical protein
MRAPLPTLIAPMVFRLTIARKHPVQIRLLLFEILQSVKNEKTGLIHQEPKQNDFPEGSFEVWGSSTLEMVAAQTSPISDLPQGDYLACSSAI